MISHDTQHDVYGPGTFTDREFIPVPQDCHRIMNIIAGGTPGFNVEKGAIDAVKFIGGDLPIIPGPLKAQQLVCFVFILLRMLLIHAAECCTACNAGTCG